MYYALPLETGPLPARCPRGVVAATRKNPL